MTNQQPTEEDIKLDPAYTHVDPSVWIADTARVFGQVTIGKLCGIWFGAVVRADTNQIHIGDGTNVQDNAVVHVDPEHACTIGKDCTLGHAAIVHGATVGDNVIVGIGAMVLNGAVVGDNCIIGAGAVVTEGTHIPPNSLVLGVPGKVVRALTPDHLERIHSTAHNYQRLGQIYRAQYGKG